jgi:hypothetical protein
MTAVCAPGRPDTHPDTAILHKHHLTNLIELFAKTYVYISLPCANTFYFFETTRNVLFFTPSRPRRPVEHPLLRA